MYSLGMDFLFGAGLQFVLVSFLTLFLKNSEFRFSVLWIVYFYALGISVLVWAAVWIVTGGMPT